MDFLNRMAMLPLFQLLLPSRRNGWVLPLTIYVLLFAAIDICTADSIAAEDKVEYVIAISVDGLVPAKVKSNLDELPNFRRLRNEGAYTDNARNQFMSSQTSPNHASMLTGTR